MRLQKVLAQAGHGSRRSCEELITSGRVTVDGRVVKRLGTTVDPATQAVSLDGEAVTAPQRKVYFLLHKPKGVLCTVRDPEGRTTVLDLVRERERIYPVGRLDLDSEGLLLLTNDGDLAQRLIHPRFGIMREYLVTVDGYVERAVLDKLHEGVRLAEGKTMAVYAHVVHLGQHRSQVSVRIREGKNREVRRILARVDLKVRRLVRTRLGPLSLKDLKSGRYRRLKPGEVEALFAATAEESRVEVVRRPKPKPKPEAPVARKPGPRPGPAEPVARKRRLRPWEEPVARKSKPWPGAEEPVARKPKRWPGAEEPVARKPKRWPGAEEPVARKPKPRPGARHQR